MGFWDFLLKTYWGGGIYITIGVVMIRLLLLFPPKKGVDNTPYNFKFWAGAISLIILGITIIMAKLTGKV